MLRTLLITTKLREIFKELFKELLLFTEPICYVTELVKINSL